MRFPIFCLFLSLALPSADASLLVYDFDSAGTSLHGEITFDNSHAQFIAGGTVSIANGGIVDYFYTDGASYWDLSDSQVTSLEISFGAGGTSPGDINRQALNTTDDQLPGDTDVQLFLPAVISTNGNHGVAVGSTRVFDGTYSISAAAPVPEPASFWLLSSVAVWGLARKRRQRRKPAESISSESL